MFNECSNIPLLDMEKERRGKERKRAVENSSEVVLDWYACLGPVAPFKAGKLGDSKAQAVKVVEEASELLYAVAHGTAEDVSEELGDVVQAVVNLAAVAGINTEQACLAANARNRERGRL